MWLFCDSQHQNVKETIDCVPMSTDVALSIRAAVGVEIPMGSPMDVGMGWERIL